jgi:hypothetical protein
MIPREILKKIRQIELRTNWLVTGSTQPPFQFSGISRFVKTDEFALTCPGVKSIATQ